MSPGENRVYHKCGVLHSLRVQASPVFASTAAMNVTTKGK